MREQLRKKLRTAVAYVLWAAALSETVGIIMGVLLQDGVKARLSKLIVVVAIGLWYIGSKEQAH